VVFRGWLAGSLLVVVLALLTFAESTLPAKRVIESYGKTDGEARGKVFDGFC